MSASALWIVHRHMTDEVNIRLVWSLPLGTVKTRIRHDLRRPAAVVAGGES
jgi:hypothetical protein